LVKEALDVPPATVPERETISTTSFLLCNYVPTSSINWFSSTIPDNTIIREPNIVEPDKFGMCAFCTFYTVSRGRYVKVLGSLAYLSNRQD